MNLKLYKSVLLGVKTVQISGSKSETNRLLLLQKIFPDLELQNISDADDCVAIIKALESDDTEINIGHAGTAMRFLTAWFAIQPNRTVILDGSQRMRQRPIGILVDALRQLGAQIDFQDQDGFPPLKISGTKMADSNVVLDANVSSQYISALLLIAPALENGIRITLEGIITSRPYIEMTLSLLNGLGIQTSFVGNEISVAPKPQINQPGKTIIIESDWSSASYYYSMVALSPIGSSIKLYSFKKDSLQGDSVLSTIYQDFGVSTTFENDSIVLSKTASLITNVVLDLNSTPDLAQTIAVTCLALGFGCRLLGLKTLKIKETDRLTALQNELQKMGGIVLISDDELELAPGTVLNENVSVETYNDHRMAMAFAPLAIKIPIIIMDSDVVKKSYPRFWSDLKNIGFHFEPVDNR